MEAKIEQILTDVLVVGIEFPNGVPDDEDLPFGMILHKDNAAHAIAKLSESELAASEAKLAVMAEALEGLVANPEAEGWDGVGGNSQGDYCVYCSSHYGVHPSSAEHDFDCPIVKGRKALSAAPKVLWVGEGKIELVGPIPNEPWTKVELEAGSLWGMPTKKIQFELLDTPIQHGQQVTVLVLADDKPQEGEE